MLNDFLILMRAELVVTLLIFLLLFIKLGRARSNNLVLSVTYLLLIVHAIIALLGEQDGMLFADMFVSNKLIVLQKVMLSLATLLLLLLNHDWLKKHAHLPEFLMLLFSALLGMYLMISSGNLIIFYLALELSSIPVAAMANFDLEKKRSSEAAMKMILSSAFSSGVLLFGISLLYGSTGTISFSTMATLVQGNALEITGFLLFFAGIAFKLSVVPFHFWTADVYEGAPVVVTSFLSVVSKGSIAFVLITLLYKVFESFGPNVYRLLEMLAVATLLVGNLFALRQKNLKRFLAFSSVAQVGFILVGVSSLSAAGTAAVTYFILVYIFSNLAAFGVISIISEATGKENIEDYKGLYQNNKMLSWVMAIALFSLAGIPPTAGFFGKLFLIMAGAGTVNASVGFISLVAMNLVLSLYYYLRVVRAIFMETNDHPMQQVPVQAAPRVGLMICTVAIVVVGLIGWIYEYIKSLS